MTKGVKKSNDDVDQLVQSALSKGTLPIVRIDQGTAVYRVQPTEYDDPVFYNPDSDSRYGDRDRKIGVCYVAGSGEVAIAETFQSGAGGHGTPVLTKDIEERSLHRLKTARTLNLVDAGRLAAHAGKKLRDIVEAKGQGSEGYAFTQAMSSACMRHPEDFDGILYPSAVYPQTGAIAGCNMALFGGKGKQLTPESAEPLMEVKLQDGTVVEFLDLLDVTVE